MKPHKWANEIKAWADGAVIEVQDLLDDRLWYFVKTPDWGNCALQFRIKPRKKKYRVWKTSNGKACIAANEKDGDEDQGRDNFAGWLGDWVEYD